MRQRLTIRVSDVIEEVNQMNKISTCDRDKRIGWNVLASDILHKTGNYNGYRHLCQVEVPKGQLAGVIDTRRKTEAGATVWEFPDDSRIQYYI